MKYVVVFANLQNSALYQVTVPDLPGCSVSVESIDLGLEKIRQSIKSHLAILAEYGEKIPSALSIEKHRQHNRTLNIEKHRTTYEKHRTQHRKHRTSKKNTETHRET